VAANVVVTTAAGHEDPRAARSSTTPITTTCTTTRVRSGCADARTRIAPKRYSARPRRGSSASHRRGRPGYPSPHPSRCLLAVGGPSPPLRTPAPLRDELRV
jgi:hypothetical protein